MHRGREIRWRVQLLLPMFWDDGILWCFSLLFVFISGIVSVMFKGLNGNMIEESVELSSWNYIILLSKCLFTISQRRG